MLVVGMQSRLLGQQLIMGLFMFRIMGNTIDRTHLNTLRLVIETDALGAPLRIDHINFITR